MASPAIDALVEEVRGDLGTHSASAWLRKLLPLAKQNPSWFESSDLARLARYLARNTRWSMIDDDAERQDYLTQLNLLLAAAREPAPVACARHCAAIKSNGIRCDRDAKDGYTCGIPAHVRQGAVMLCPGDDDDDVPTGHPSEFTCMGCGGDAATDHPPSSNYMSCVACSAQFITTCVVAAEGGQNAIPADHSIVCEVCIEEGRGTDIVTMLTATNNADDEPCLPDLIVVKIHESLRGNGTTRGTRARARSAAGGGAAGTAGPRHAEGGGTASGSAPAAGSAPATAGPRGPRTTTESARANHAPTPGGHRQPGASGDASAAPGDTVSGDPATAALLQRLALQMAVLQEQMASASRPPLAAAGGSARPIADERLDAGATPADHNAHGPVSFWHGVRPVPISEFVGVKAGSDVAGRPASNIHHYLHLDYGKYIDYLCLANDDAAKRARSALGYVEPNGTAAIPDRHRWEDYIKALMNYHTRMAKMDHPAFHGISSESQDRVNQVVLIICRCRWLFGLTHGMARCGGDTTTWQDTYAMLKQIYHSEIELTDYTPFDQFFPKLVDEQKRLLSRGEDPNLSDRLQDQINGAARGRASNYLAAHAAAREAAPARGGRDYPRPTSCGLCGSSGHMADQHPKNRPITIPCNVCGDLHYRKLTPCKKQNGKQD